MKPLAERLDELAKTFPETVTAPSCSNTAYKARKKAFLYVGTNDKGTLIRLRLGPGLDQARAMAAAAPHIYQVANIGWVTIRLPPGESGPEGLLERWVEESFRVLAPKKLVTLLNGRPAADLER